MTKRDWFIMGALMSGQRGPQAVAVADEVISLTASDVSVVCGGRALQFRDTGDEEKNKKIIREWLDNEK